MEEDEHVEPHIPERKRAKRFNVAGQKLDEISEKTQSSKILDGGAVVALGSENNLLFFTKTNPRDGKVWICKSFDGIAVAASQKQMRSVKFAIMTDEEQSWYLGQLQIDVVNRFHTSADSLFASCGSFILAARERLLQNPGDASTIMQQIEAGASPLLSATNNTALMLAATQHKILSEENADGWYQTFEAQVLEMCTRCHLKFNTIVRYRKVGELMLQSRMIACMLPFFVFTHEEAIEALLDDKTALRQLEQAFDAKVNQVMKPLPPPPAEGDMTQRPPEPLPFADDDLILNFDVYEL